MKLKLPKVAIIEVGADYTPYINSNYSIDSFSNSGNRVDVKGVQYISVPLHGKLLFVQCNNDSLYREVLHKIQNSNGNVKIPGFKMCLSTGTKFASVVGDKDYWQPEELMHLAALNKLRYETSLLSANIDRILAIANLSADVESKYIRDLHALKVQAEKTLENTAQNYKEL